MVILPKLPTMEQIEEDIELAAENDPAFTEVPAGTPLYKHCTHYYYIPLGSSDKKEEVDECIKFVSNSQWVQNEGNKLLEHITSQIDNYITELEESINYKR